MNTNLSVQPTVTAAVPIHAVPRGKSAICGRERVRRGPMARVAQHVEVLVMTVAWRGAVMARALFSLGEVFATGRALQSLESNAVAPETLLARHATGDWEASRNGDEPYQQAAVREATRVLSTYTLPDERQVCLMTEADRSATLIYVLGE